jgi:uncharacterized protein (TIGR00730 family)
VSVTDLIKEFLAEIEADTAQSPEQVAALRDLLEKVLERGGLGPNAVDLTVALSALDELLDASSLFAPWRSRAKVTVFGSARTDPGHPLYHMARELSSIMTERGWMTITGAGGGIMEASSEGAGRENTLGVNIELPFEQGANPYIDQEKNLVSMKYFFTRKVAMTRESQAFVAFPGGLGTLDEAFEILTLLHTGKTDPAPVVLVDTPDGTYWDRWLDFIIDEVVAGDYIGPLDMCLVAICHGVAEAIDEIERFYSNYVSVELGDGRASLLVRRVPNVRQLDELAAIVAAFAAGEGFKVEGSRVSFNFDGRNYANLRLIINALNDLVDEG